MKDITSPKTGKILVHNQGLGDPSEADVHRRAHELALIDGRTDITAEDRRRAEKELRGDMVPPTSDVEEISERRVSRDPSEPASNPGRQVPNREGSDESAVPERLALEGVEEAQHEQMVEDRRHPRA
jgi:hypothetical protein